MSKLILGWNVTNGLEPEYWLKNGAKSGFQTEADLVTIPADKIGNHVVIIGQSGSGKSFFLGRFIEEILLKTRSKCIVIDPNSDFHLMYKVAENGIWDHARYNPVSRSGKLPCEKTRKDFSDKWKKITKCIYTNSGAYEWNSVYKNIKIWWPTLSSEIITEDEDFYPKIQLYHCHEFVKAISHLMVLKPKDGENDRKRFGDPIKESEKYWNKWEEDQSLDSKDADLKTFENAINHDFDVDTLAQNIHFLEYTTIKSLNLRRLPKPDGSISTKRIIRFAEARNRIIIKRWLDIATTSLKYVTIEAGHNYFAKANEFRASNILTTIPQASYLQSERLGVIDLSSLPNKNIRSLIINSLLEGLWSRARSAWEDAIGEPENQDKRVPTFIVLDEAHNYIPAQPRSKGEAILLEQFRAIAAEGRKFGLFLILASQRPDKLDPLTLSECENKILMKVDSASV